MTRRTFARLLPFTILLALPLAAPALADPWCYEELQTCRDALFLEGDMVQADNCFDAHLTVSPPCDQVAAAFRAVTRVLRFPEDRADPLGPNNSWEEILDRFGVSQDGRSMYDFHPALPKNQFREIDLPADSPEIGDVQQTIQTLAMIAAIDTSIAELTAIPPSTIVYLRELELEGIGIRRSFPLELDHSDLLAARAALQVLKGNLLMGLAYNLDFDIDSYTPVVHPFNVQAFLIDAHPLLFSPNLAACTMLTDAKSAYQAAVDDHALAFLSLVTEVDIQSDDFITLDCITPEGAISCSGQNEIMVHAADVRSSLDGRVSILDKDTPHEETWINELNEVVGTTFRISGNDQGATADLSIAFSCNPVFSPRDGDTLPRVHFSQHASPPNFINTASFADKTFGGILLPVPEPNALVPGLVGLVLLARRRPRSRSGRS